MDDPFLDSTNRRRSAAPVKTKTSQKRSGRATTRRVEVSSDADSDRENVRGVKVD